MAESKNVFNVGSRVSIYKFPPEQIKIDPKLNGRVDLPDIDWLVKDIVEHGQLEPVIVRKDGDKPALVAGFSRWRSIIKINKEKLTPQPLEILATYFRGNERDGFLANIRENRFRNSTSALDDAHNVAQMMAWNMADDVIASVYFPNTNGDDAAKKKSIAWVKRTAKLANLTPEARVAVKEGRIKVTAAAHIAELASDAQRELVKREGKIKGSDVAEASGKKQRLGLAGLRKVLTDAANGLMTPTGKRIPNDVADWIVEICEKA